MPQGGGGEESEGEEDEAKASGWLCSQQQQLVRAQLQFDSARSKWDTTSSNHTRDS